MALRRQLTNNPKLYYKIVVLGSGGVGKSALTIRFCSDQFVEEYDPTIEDLFYHQIDLDDEPVLLDILDTAGQEEFQIQTDAWIRDADGVLLVYSITDSTSFDYIEHLRQQIHRVSYDEVDEDKQLPIVLCGNKCDLKSQRKVTLRMGMEKAKEMNCPFFETSAKTKTKSVEVFHETVRQIRRWKTKDEDGKKEKKWKIRCTFL